MIPWAGCACCGRNVACQTVQLVGYQIRLCPSCRLAPCTWAGCTIKEVCDFHQAPFVNGDCQKCAADERRAKLGEGEGTPIRLCPDCDGALSGKREVDSFGEQYGPCICKKREVADRAQ